MSVQTQSLWISARDKLDEADQKLLAFDSSNTSIKDDDHRAELDILEGLSQTTREAYDTCIHKRWQLTIPGSRKKIIIRDLLGKIARWIQLFQSVGDQIVQYDPGHAALPWAGARFLLQIAINDFNKFNFVVQGAEKIARMTARYHIIERIYVRHYSAAAKQLGQAVVRVYGAILKYLVLAKRYFQERTAVRLFKSGLLGQDDFQEVLDRMEVDEKEVDRCANLVQAEINNDTTSHLSTISLEMENFSLLRNTLKQIEHPISQMAFQLEKVDDYLDSVQRRQILDWLSIQPYLDHHRTIQSRVLDGTCQWVLEHDHFSKWKGESMNSLLWLHGTQGAGKSCIASTVIEDGLQVSSMSRNFAHAHFYCSRNTAEPQRAKAQDIIGCIARQLSSPSSEQPLATPTVALYKRMQSTDGSTTTPDLQQLSDLIKELTEAYCRTTIVIDALDECGMDERAELIEKLEYITHKSTSLVKVFITSREEGDLRLHLQTNSGIQVTWLENGPDIEKFVNFETDKLVAKNQLLVYIRGRAKEELKVLIKEEVVSKANGMFRWAQLKLQSLRWIRTERDIRIALSEFPRQLSELYEELYQNALRKTRETDAALFQNTLRWMLCATRVLAWEDFSQAITSFVDIETCEIYEDIILDLLSNFVIFETTEERTHTFRFAHLSVREFLETKPEYCSESSNTFAAEVCLLKVIGACGSPDANRFLGQLDLSAKTTATLSETDSYKKGIYDYSLRNWRGHCARAGEKNRANDTLHLFQLFRYFLFNDSGPNCPLNCWVRSRQRRKMESMVNSHMLRLFRNYHQSRDRAFLLSCMFGFSEIPRLDQYSKLDGDVREQCIMAAAIFGKFDILQFLIGETKDEVLQKRVLYTLVINHDLESLRWFLAFIEPSLITKRVIVRAAIGENKEIINLLLRHNKNIRITSELIEKCGWKYEVIKELLSRTPDVAITPRILGNVIRYIEIDTLRGILDKNDSSIITCEVIAELGYSGHESENQRLKMELLLQRAGRTKVTEKAMARALERNSSCGMVKMLLDHGWPVNQNILQEAAEWGMPSPFNLLLEAGGQLTPEVIASGAKNLYYGGAMVKLLVSLMDNPLDDDLWVQMMLCCAKNTWGNPETLQALLEMKPGLKVPKTNLIAFTENDIKGNIIMDMILKDGREMEITEAVIESALRNLGYTETIPKLLDRYGSAKISNRFLVGAVSNRRFGDEMTKLLLQRYVSVEKPSPEVMEAIIQNRDLGYEVLQILEARFGRLEFNETHFETAGGSGSIQILNLVISRSSITEATPSVLLKAASGGSLAVMKHLLTLDKATISKEMLIVASGNTQCATDMLKFLWNLAPHIAVCPDMFIVATNCYSGISTDFEFMFDWVKDAQKCQEILNAVMLNKSIMYDSAYIHILDLILESDFEIEVTDDLVMGIFTARHGSVLKTFIEHGVDIKLSQDMVNKAVDLNDYPALKVLIRYGNPQELDLQAAMAIVDNAPIRWV